MSGGSYDYIYRRLEEECEGRMYDAEMDDMIRDLAEVLHDLEWWQSADSSEDEYRATLTRFKIKWFKGNREERLKGYIDNQIGVLRKQLYALIGEPIRAESKQEPKSEWEHDHEILKAYSDGANGVLDEIRAEIAEEKEHAYADFERYKVEYLGQDWEDALDSLPQDDFRYGMERCIDIIGKYKVESEDK